MRDAENEKIKTLFCDIDENELWKLNRDETLKFFAKLYEKIGDKFEHVANVSEECFEDVWHEIDYAESGFVTWH